MAVATKRTSPDSLWVVRKQESADLTQNQDSAGKKKRGRPPKNRDALIGPIISGIAAGRSLVNVLNDLGNPVNPDTVYDWLSKDPSFSEKYTRARETQADTLADEIIAIADDATGDTFIDEEGRERVDHENINRSRLRVDARKWVAAKLKPKVYGDKVQLDQTVTLNAEQVEGQLAALLGKLGGG